LLGFVLEFGDALPLFWGEDGEAEVHRWDPNVFVTSWSPPDAVRFALSLLYPNTFYTTRLCLGFVEHRRLRNVSVLAQNVREHFCKMESKKTRANIRAKTFKIRCRYTLTSMAGVNVAHIYIRDLV